MHKTGDPVLGEEASPSPGEMALERRQSLRTVQQASAQVRKASEEGSTRPSPSLRHLFMAAAAVG